MMNRINTFFIAFLLSFSISLIAYQEIVPDQTCLIPMRDGTSLPTDIYLPHKNAKDLPCILLRSPAGRKSPYALCHVPLSKEGYMIAIQDTRNAIDPEGKTFPYWSDGWGIEKDGYDTIEWLAKHELTNGKIATLGVSAMGVTQLLLAPTAPPSLVCQYIGVAASDLFHQGVYPGGQLRKEQVEGWLGAYAKDPGVLGHACCQPFYNQFWDCFNSLKKADQVIVPALHYGGWFDTFIEGTIEAFVTRNENGGEGAQGKQKLIIGPWTHFWPASMSIGDFEIPKQGKMPPVDLSPLKWFNHYLKNEKNGIAELPPILYYVMGPFDGTPSKGNVWKSAEKWPPPSKEKSLFLTTNMSLSEQPESSSAKRTYEYNPLKPVPTLGGRNLFLESGLKNQKEIENRDDVIIFTSEPLQKDIEVTGKILFTLFFSSNVKDTDIVVRMSDVYPNDNSYLIADGLYRTGHKFCLSCDPTLDPSQPFEVNIDLLSTSIVFAKGHRIRISISSSNYPKYEKNMNIGFINSNTGQFKIAKNTIYVGKDYPSRLILPVAIDLENEYTSKSDSQPSNG